MAEKFVVKDSDEDNARWIPEPWHMRKIRRLKGIWEAFKFLAHGGRFQLFLDLSGIEPRALAPSRLFIGRDRIVINIENERRNAVSAAMNRCSRENGLVLASDDEPGFRVKWQDCTRADAWKKHGFDAVHTPEGYFVRPK